MLLHLDGHDNTGCHEIGDLQSSRVVNLQMSKMFQFLKDLFLSH